MFSNLRNTLFSTPKQAATTVWATSTFILTIPTCIELVPRGNTYQSAKKNHSAAKQAYKQTAKKLNDLNALITENKQRIVDIDCAMLGYPTFNQNMVGFQNRMLNSDLTPIDRLKSFWQMHFIPDKTEIETSLIKKSWITHDYELNYFYSCLHSRPCNDNSNCCFMWDWEPVRNEHSWIEKTTIEKRYANILTGSPIKTPSLDCGFYARRLQIALPEVYVEYESPLSQSGHKKNGKTFLNFFRNYASRVKISYLLDGITTTAIYDVFRNVIREDAAKYLEAKLSQFVAYAIAAFNMTGIQYLNIKEGFQQKFPLLNNEATTLNETLHEQYSALAHEENIFGNANNAWYQGLKFWLSLLFVVPALLAMLTYLILRQKNMNAENIAIEPDHLESQSYQNSASNSPTFFNSNLNKHTQKTLANESTPLLTIC